MMISCREAGRLLSESLDRKLTFWERFKARLHLFICGACSRGSRQVIFLEAAARRIAGNPDLLEKASGIRLPEDVRERIKQALTSNGS